MSNEPTPLSPSPAALLDGLPAGVERVLVHGPVGAGKSTLVAALARELAGRGRQVWCIGADPGSPAFGAPGAVALARWADGAWHETALEALCTLDAVRFRLPLADAVARLAERVPEQAWLLVDAPGAVRGVGAAELLAALVRGAGAQGILMVAPREAGTPMHGELAASPARAFRVPAHEAARPAGRDQRNRARTRAWDARLGTLRPTTTMDLDAVTVVGTPPPRTAAAWCGRQVAALKAGSRPVLGEVVDLQGATLHVRFAAAPAVADVLLVRDAQRDARGRLTTAPRPPNRPPAAGTVPDAGGAAPGCRVAAGPLTATLPNGVFGDPLLELCLANVRDTVLFDLGDAHRLPVKALHRVTDVFVSHGHLDHIGGFLDLLRARLSGEPPPCRLIGPPGMHDHVAGFVAGIRWDRIGDAGPALDVGEVHGGTVRWARIQPGCRRRDQGSRTIDDGVLLARDGFRVRHAMVDHGIPVLAYALEVEERHQVDRRRLADFGQPPGPWLAALKQHLARGETQAPVFLPDGGRRPAAELGRALLEVVPGWKLAYATDLADTPPNRHALERLARHADLFVCEATFRHVHRDQAQRTQHLTGRACVEIALAAKVERLLPFHFSRRYADDPAGLYAELRDLARGTRLVGGLQWNAGAMWR